MTRPELILASGSSSRRTMLAAAGVEFTAVVPQVDEDGLRAKMPAAKGDAVAEHLAEQKARAVSAHHPGALVLGCDQVLVCEGRLFNKALDDSQASATLRALRGRTHELISAAVLAKDDDVAWRCTDVARLSMRDFSDAYLKEYLQAELPDILGSVGCYRIEGRGAQLFERVEGDQFTIRGLPLIPLLAALRAEGALLS
jgi:nucleoside triphosphate pyrophosphatase